MMLSPESFPTLFALVGSNVGVNLFVDTECSRTLEHFATLVTHHRHAWVVGSDAVLWFLFRSSPLGHCQS